MRPPVFLGWRLSLCSFRKPSRYLIRGSINITFSTQAHTIAQEFGRTNETKENVDNSNVDRITSLLQKCSCLLQGKRIHEHIVEIGLEHCRFLRNLLIQMYRKCGSLENARTVFDNMQNRNSFSWNIMMTGYIQHGDMEEALILFRQAPFRNVVTWNAMISGYIQLGQMKEALQLFQQMPEKNVVSWTSIVVGYTQNGLLNDAFFLFQQMPSRNVVSWTAIIAGYAQHGFLDKAFQLFCQMPERNLFSWNTMLAAYVQHGELEHALKFFECMSCKDAVSWNILISGYGQAGNLHRAFELFQQMPQRDIVSWNIMIAAYAQHGLAEGAFGFFEKMPERNMSSWNTMVTAYIQQGQILEAMELFQDMPQRDIVSWNAILSGYCQDGSLEQVLQFFHQMPQHDLVSWNAMISAYGRRGMLKESLLVFERMEMEHVCPDRATFVSILDACGSYSTLSERMWIHSCIISYGLESSVAIQNALINMYARCGILEEARAVFAKMGKRDVISWTTIVSANAQHGDGDIALQTIQQMLRQGVMLNEVTLRSILAACTHTGLVSEGCHFFVSIVGCHGIVETVEHYNRVIDLLARMEWLEEAEVLIGSMPFLPGVTAWTTLLGSCRPYFGEQKAKFIMDL